MFSFLRKKLGTSHSLAFLNSAQFLGALNDNIFKLLLVYLLIDVQGADKASSILSLAGAIFVIPFLLFSSAAGVLADRFSKQKLLVLMKIAEFTLMTLAIFAFAFRSGWACYTILFLLATHSAMFGPSKYGIIPELVTSDRVSRANGLITSFTYLAIILGTFLASFVTEITNRNFPLTAGFCLLIALGGFVSTFGIKKTNPQGSKKKFNLFFLSEIVKTLISIHKKPHLLMAIFGSSFFLFIGGYTQLNIIPFAIQSLGLAEVDGGYLFLATALGIAFGAFLIGKLMKNSVELAVSCLAGLFISLFLILLYFFSSNLYMVIALLFLLGAFGGIFIVPFDSFIQLHSPHEKRGQVIASTNFLSFVGVLLASFALYLFSDVLSISSAGGFAIIGVLTLLFTIVAIARLPDYVFPFLLRPFYKIKVEGEQLLNKQTMLILPNAQIQDIFFLMCQFPDIHFFIPREKSKKPFLVRLLYSADFIDDTSVISLEKISKDLAEEEKMGCLFLYDPINPTTFEKRFNIKNFILGDTFRLIFVKMERKKREITLFLSKKP